MLTRQAASTMGKFVLLCCHFDTVFLKVSVASIFLLRVDGGRHPAVAFSEPVGRSVGSPRALWDSGRTGTRSLNTS